MMIMATQSPPPTSHPQAQPTRNDPGRMLARTTPPPPHPPVPPQWHDPINQHVRRWVTPAWQPALIQLSVTIVGFLLLHFFALPLTLPLAVLFRVRLFILTHDMAHGAFFPSRRANTWAANLIMPMAAYTPASFWRKTHRYHHMHANVLDRDDTPWTTTKYLAAPKQARLVYRLLNHPVAMLSGLVPATVYFIIQQFSPTNHLWELTLELLVLAVHFYRGSLAFELASATGGALIGMLLFNVQHSFHGVHRSRAETWDNVTNAIFGSSLLVLPWWLAWFTAGLEYHHVHHLNPRVPCYRLRECHEAAKESLFKHVSKVQWWQMVTVLPYSLWDEARGKMVRPEEVVVGGIGGGVDRAAAGGSDTKVAALFAQ